MRHDLHTVEIANSGTARRLVSVLSVTTETAQQQRTERRTTQRRAQVEDMAHVSTRPSTSATAAPIARRQIMKIIIKDKLKIALIMMR